VFLLVSGGVILGTVMVTIVTTGYTCTTSSLDLMYDLSYYLLVLVEFKLTNCFSGFRRCSPRHAYDPYSDNR